MAKDIFPYQEVGAQWLVYKDRYGLHDEMGIGKTATTIRAIDMIGAKRGVVVVPAMLRENWIKEFRRFSYRDDIRLCKAKSVHDFEAWRKGRFNILICSYEMASNWAPAIQRSCEILDFVAMDEAHYVKNAASKRTRALLGHDLTGNGGLINFAEHVWHITGTPMANDPLDIYTFLQAMHAVNMPQQTFTKRYFNSLNGRHGSRQTAKPEMLPELKALIGNNAIRRTMADVGLQLPPIFLTTYTIDGNTDAVRQMLREHPGLESAVYAAIERGGLSSDFFDTQHLGTLRRMIGEAKAVPYGHMLIQELYSRYGKRVVFGVHKDALAGLHAMMARAGIRSVIVQGETAERARVEAVRAFNEDDDCMVFIGNMRAAGVGNNLQYGSSNIDVLESEWSPAANAQAIKRVHRIGQKFNVNARFITLAESIDETVNEIVAEKTAAIAMVDRAEWNAVPA